MEDIPQANDRDDDDDDEESSNHSHAHVRQDSQSTISTATTDRDQDQDQSQLLPPLPPSRRSSRRGRESPHHDVPHSEEESEGLMSPTTNTNTTTADDDDRGEAPPYFEVADPTMIPQLQNPPAAVLSQPSATSTDLAALTSSSSSSSSPQPLQTGIAANGTTTTTSTSTTTSPPTSPERRSGIRTFFNRMQTAGAPRGMGHARGHSAASTSTEAGPSTSPTGSRLGHHTRNSPSTASSLFRTLSRQRSQSSLGHANLNGSNARLNSPSMLSLNSISHPLTHTLTRTEITYPKDGPTPEQLKMISSRESIARFGVPYGADAVAFAASTTSLANLGAPPDFETVMGAGSMSTTSLVAAASSTMMGAGESRVSLNRHVRGDSAGSARVQMQHTSSPLSASQTDDSSAPSTSSPSSPSPSSSSRPPQSAPATGPTSFTMRLETQDINGNDDPSKDNTRSDTVTTRGTVSTLYKSLAPSVAASRYALGDSSTSPSDEMSEFGGLRPSANSRHGTRRTGSVHSRASARSQSGNRDDDVLRRPDSRASGYSQQSFATANESVRTRARMGAGSRVGDRGDFSDDDDDEDEGVRGGTPRVGTPVPDGTISSQHGREATDATIVASVAVLPAGSLSSTSK